VCRCIGPAKITARQIGSFPPGLEPFSGVDAHMDRLVRVVGWAALLAAVAALLSSADCERRPCWTPDGYTWLCDE